MQSVLLIISLIVTTIMCTYGQTKQSYLHQNRFDLRANSFQLPLKEFKVIGFGAYHGSEKTEDAELILIKDLIDQHQLRFYLPETDFSTAHFFNQYLISGDTAMLFDLVKHYGYRVPQEATTAVFKKWQSIKKINDQLPKSDKLKVIGVDAIASLKYTVLHLLQITKPIEKSLSTYQNLSDLIRIDTQEYLIKEKLDIFIPELNSLNLKISSEDSFALHQIIKNLKDFEVDSLTRTDKIIQNYSSALNHYNLNIQKHFFRYGFAHLLKSKENHQSSFFTRLIEEGYHTKKEMISIIGYLTKSRVIWNTKFNRKGAYKGYNTKGGFGIGDYRKEYFLGIDYLKKAKISDLTLFQLNQLNSPYKNQVPELIEIKLKKGDANQPLISNKSTTDFIDFALLISSSKAAQSIFELESK